MRKGYVFVYHGEGRGKTTLAIGQGMRMLGEGLRVVMIQFLDYNNTKEIIPLKKMEPEFRVFRFEKQRDGIEALDLCAQKELKNELMIAFNFSNKIMETGECDLLILDGILDAVDKGFLECGNVAGLLEKRPAYMDVILTGQALCEDLKSLADYIYRIETEKRPQAE